MFSLQDGPVFHITCVMHNTRVSQRMIAYQVKSKEPLCMETQEEEQLVRMCCEAIREDKLKVYAFNVCQDHTHLLLKCDHTNLPGIVGRFKSRTARSFNIWMGFTESEDQLARGHAPLSRGVTQNSLWAQKFNRVEIKPFHQFQNTIHYIENNRIKHQLPEFTAETIAMIRGVLSDI